jgi:GT2 family glycosyltransferase
LEIDIHVVDNASADESAEMVRQEFPNVDLIRNQINVGFAAACNQSLRRAGGRYWLLLNSDTELRSGALDALVRFMDATPRAGLTTARLLNPDGTPQHCAQRIPGIGLTLLEASRLHKLLDVTRRGRLLLGPYWTYDRAIRVGWTWGTALIARRHAVEQVGLLNENLFMYGEDLDWCLRMRRNGWEIWFCPEAEVIHYGAQSARQRWDESNHRKLILDGTYRAIGMHSGRGYVAILHLIHLGALCSNWRNVDKRAFAAARGYHVQALRRILLE